MESTEIDAVRNDAENPAGGVVVVVVAPTTFDLLHNEQNNEISNSGLMDADDEIVSPDHPIRDRMSASRTDTTHTKHNGHHPSRKRQQSLSSPGTSNPENSFSCIPPCIPFSPLQLPTLKEMSSDVEYDSCASSSCSPATKKAKKCKSFFLFLLSCFCY